VKKELYPFLLKLSGFSLILGYFWYAGLQRYYPELIDPVASPILTMLGVRRWWLALVAEHFTNIIAYLALVLATAGLISQWKRHLIALFGGTAIIVLVHILMSAAVYYLELKYSMSKSFYKIIVPIYIFNDALPLVLWLLFFQNEFVRIFGFWRKDE
jgi:hypothetical protein